MQIKPLNFVTSPKVEFTSTSITSPTPSLPSAAAVPQEQFIPSVTPKAVPDLVKEDVVAQSVEAKPPAEPDLKPTPTVASNIPVQESWMNQDWNLGPGSNAESEKIENLWKHPAANASVEHSKIMVIDDQATYFVNAGVSKTPELDPLMSKITEFSKDQGINSNSSPLWPPMGSVGGLGPMVGIGSMIGKGLLGPMEGMSLDGLGGIGSQDYPNPFFNPTAPAQQPLQDVVAHEIYHAGYPPLFSDLGGGITNFNHAAAEQQKWLEDLKKLDNGDLSGLQDGASHSKQMTIEKQGSLQDLAKAQDIKNTTAVNETQAKRTCNGLNRDQVIQGVNTKLSALGVTNIIYAVDEKLFSSLDKLKLDPVDFFTARTCWQGVSTKRRAILEKVLDQFPDLPKDQKNWQAAVASAETKGTLITNTDKVFIQYFLENRKAMKSLFRATLPSGFKGNSAICYRGQSNSSKFGPHTTKPLGCYSTDPDVAAAFGGNIKRFKVKLNDVWSTYTATQNNNRQERELTVYSRGGIRKGEKVKNIDTAADEFKASYAEDKLAQSLEKPQYKPSWQ